MKRSEDDLKSLHDREVAECRAMVRECDRLMIETRKDLRAIAMLQKSTAEALKRPWAPAAINKELRLSPK